MSARWMLALMVAGLALTAATARAQGDERLRSRLEPATASQIQAIVDAASAAGLPSEPLVLKALEGASKGAGGSAIAGAVERLHTQLGSSRRAIGNGASSAEIVAGAAALQAGVDVETLRGLRAARSDQSLTVALSVLTDLIARGVPVPAASQAVLAIVRSGAHDDQLVAFRRGIERDIMSGTAPAAAAANRAPGAPPSGIPSPPGTPPVSKDPGGARPPLS